MKNLIICGEMHYRQNYLDQTLLAELNLKTPNELKVVMLDPSLDSLCEFEGLPHLLFPICDGAHIRDALSRLCDMIKKRRRNDIDRPIILVVADRWLPKGDVKCLSMLKSILADGQSSGIYVWCSFDDAGMIPEELRAKIDSFYADKDSFDFDNDIYDKCREKTNILKEKYG